MHRGSDVDRLSEEEAGIIAVRLVERISGEGLGVRGKGESDSV